MAVPPGVARQRQSQRKATRRAVGTPRRSRPSKRRPRTHASAGTTHALLPPSSSAWPCSAQRRCRPVSPRRSRPRATHSGRGTDARRDHHGSFVNPCGRSHGIGSSDEETRRAVSQAESLCRPLPRRRWIVARPAAVRIRVRNPCLRLRRRLFGWYVRFMMRLSLRVEVEVVFVGGHGTPTV